LEALKEAPSTKRADGAWKTFLGEKTRSEEGKARMAMAMAMAMAFFFFFFKGFENARNYFYGKFLN